MDSVESYLSVFDNFILVLFFLLGYTFSFSFLTCFYPQVFCFVCLSKDLKLNIPVDHHVGSHNVGLIL